MGRTPGSLCSQQLPQVPLLASVALGDAQPLSGALGGIEKGGNIDYDCLKSPLGGSFKFSSPTNGSVHISGCLNFQCDEILNREEH